MKRLNLLTLATAISLLLGMLLSIELWFGFERSFPRAPMFFAVPAIVELILSGVLMLALGATIFAVITTARWQKISFVIAIAAIILLMILDQNRMQPWVYQYLLILAVLALSDAKDATSQTSALGLVQLLLAGLYIWSGIQKMNFSFATEMLPMLLEPAGVTSVPIVAGIAIALAEALIGIGLLIRKTRNVAVIAGAAMHVTLIVTLAAIGHNEIVWLWNAALIALLIFAFWRSDLSLRHSLSNASTTKQKAARAMAMAAVTLPALSFVGLWDMYLSGALYSANVKQGIIHVDDAAFARLPPEAQRSVVSGQGDAKLIPLFEWAIADLNVPVYPESRVFKQIAREVCRTIPPTANMELLIIGRPDVMSGEAEVERVGCGVN